MSDRRAYILLACGVLAIWAIMLPLLF